MNPDHPTPEQVAAILAGAVAKHPTDSELLPVLNFLLPVVDVPLSTSASSSSSTSKSTVHFYCSKCPSAIHREAATYLLYLFAFQRAGTASRFIQGLEKTLSGCVNCARSFGGIKGKFGSKYLAFLPPQARSNFFRALDDYQCKLILDNLKSLSLSGADSPTLFGLPSSTIQLLFSGPSLLANAEISTALDNAITIHYSSAQPNITSYGLNPLMVRLLSSASTKRRSWAISQIPACARRPVSFEHWCSSGLGEQVQTLYTGTGDASQAERLKGMEALLRCGALSADAVEKGLIEGRLEPEGEERGQQGFMFMLSHLLGSPSEYYPTILNCFSLLLSTCPSPVMWTFDTSPELPHTLFSEIKDNASLQQSITQHYQSSSPPAPQDGTILVSKGKGKECDSDTPMSWISDFLRSLVPLKGERRKSGKEMALPQALAKAMNFCFAEMQHERVSVEVKAASAQCGFEALADVRKRISDSGQILQTAFSSTLQVHAKYIAAVALRPNDWPGQAWASARLSAQSLLEQCFNGDGRDIVESMLGLAHIAFHEKRRLKRSRGGREAPAPQPVTNLHRASVHGELWRMAYDNVGTADVAGVAIFLKTISTFSHVELLDRRNAWRGESLKAVVKEEHWIDSIRAINHGLRNSREGFAHALESLAMQPDTALTRTLWDIPGVPRSAIILLLSPIDEIHDPIISLIQQAFDDTDDRLDCFRILLQKYPDQAMEGLRFFLQNFIQTAQKTPDSCSLAKWLVRCFTDVLDVLCNPSSSEPLLHDEAFLSNDAGGVNMSKRVGDLWSLMTESLSVIFDRTKDWAPLYENEVMVDWMRDALIFGRGMTEHIRVFEAAFRGQSGSRFSGDDVDSPLKITHVGKRMVEKLEKVLKHLVSWLRLTDVETLHQTFELIKTIVGRIAKAKPDLTKTPDLEATLQDIDKFSRRADTNHRTRLSDDYLSELAGILDPFELGLADDEVQFLKEQKATPSETPSSSRDREIKTPSSGEPMLVTKKNAFEEMMKTAGKSKTPSSSQASTSKTPKKPVASSSSKPTDVIDIDDDDFDDSFLDQLSGGDLDMIEKKAKVASTLPKPVFPRSAFPVRHTPTAAAQKLNINVVPRRPLPTKSSAPSFKSKFMQEARREHKMGIAERGRAQIGGINPVLPPSSRFGTGLGAHTGPPRKIKMVESESSATDSSDEDNAGMKALAQRQISPVKRAAIVPPKIKMMGSAMDDVLRVREERRNAQHRIKQRLRPDISDLHRYILSWDPQHVGPTPPHHPQYAALTSKLGPVPPTFPSAKLYEQTMLPLFLQELWSQSQQERPPMDAPTVIEVSARQYDDGFVDIDVFSKQMYANFVNESDVVVLSQPGQTTRVLAKVQSFKKKQNIAQIKLRVSTLMDKNLVVPKTVWHMTKHFSLSTAIREFGALKGLPYYEPELLSDILAGRAARMPRLTSNAIDDAMEAYSVNEPQAKAILGAMESRGFALIQGPPGTGKTKTISGLVGKFLSERRTPIPTDGQKAIKPKILVCAPSNAAIDEVCKRLLNGVPSSKGNLLHPTIVRIGIEKSVNISVKEVSLDSLVEAAVSASSSHGVGNDYTRIQAQQAELKDKISAKQNQIQVVHDFDDRKKTLENELHALMSEKVALVKESSRARDAVKDASRHLDGARRAARDSILQDADIICATLSGSGHESLAPYTFETVIIDEAAQAIEMSCLIPLKYGCQRCIMVGDPNQLPPTTISQDVERFHYNESLFVRIAKRDKANMHLLSIQYRMHPFISELPSKVFYDGQLKDGEDMAGKTSAVWHRRNVYGPYRFFNVEGIEQKKGTSTYNPAEAAAAVELYSGLERDFADKVNLSLRIGVISMYKEQVGELKRTFTRTYGEDILQKIEFNTVDGFQGQEKDIIILSTVRSGSSPTIGFLKDARRMNVALTRAKSSLFVIGNARTLERGDERWKTIVGDARDRGFLIDYDARTFESAPMDVPPPISKPKIKKDKSDKIKTLAEKPSVPPVKHTPTQPVSMVPPPNGNSSKPMPSGLGSSTARQDSHPDKQKDLALPPKSIPSKRPSDVSSSAPVSEAKKPNLHGDKQKISTTSAPTRPVANGNGTNLPKGLPRPAPPPGRPPPPPPPTRAAEDVLFIKKKKKKPNSGPPPPAGGPSVRGSL